jgi:hypothetical protein
VLFDQWAESLGGRGIVFEQKIQWDCIGIVQSREFAGADEHAISGG